MRLSVVSRKLTEERNSFCALVRARGASLAVNRMKNKEGSDGATSEIFRLCEGTSSLSSVVISGIARITLSETVALHR